MRIFRNAGGDIVIDWGEGNSPRYARYNLSGFLDRVPKVATTKTFDGKVVHALGIAGWEPVYDSSTGLNEVQRELLRRLLESLGVSAESACSAPYTIEKLITAGQ